MMEPIRLEQSTWLRFVLCAAHILEGPGRPLLRLNAPHLLAAARRRTHLHDFGDPALQEPLRRLVQSMEGEARLNFIGRVAAREDLTHMLMNRLKMERDRQQHPDIAAEQIRRPLFITGLPRTGSTFLHGLLAQDPANRRHPRSGQRTRPTRASNVLRVRFAGSSASHPSFGRFTSSAHAFPRSAPSYSAIHS
jgi:Sulfotransferase family